VQCSTDADCVKRGSAFASSTCVESVCQESKVSTPPHGDDAGGADHAVLPVTSAKMDAGLDPDAALAQEMWGCLDKPKVTSTAPGPFHITFHLAGIVDPAPIANVSAKVCKKLDVQCTSPSDGPKLSNDTGDVSFDIDKGFTGYVSFAKGTDITPGLYFFNPPPDHDMDAVAVQIVTPGIVSALTASFMSPQKDANGLTLINVADCDGKAATGVSLVADGIDPGSVEFYSVGGLPTAAATETATEGFGGFVNVPPGPLTVKGVVNGPKRELQTISILINAGSITYAKLVPLGR
jgi:hypothetical protein